MKFSTLSESEIGKIAEVQVWKGAYYDQFKKPIPGGLLDPRMVPFNLSMSLFSRLFYLAYYISIIGFAYLICLFYSHALPRGFIKLWLVIVNQQKILLVRVWFSLFLGSKQLIIMYY